MYCTKYSSNGRGVKLNLSSEPFPKEINKHIEYTHDSLQITLLYLEYD